MNRRPRVEIKLTPTDKLFEGAAWTTFVLLWALPTVYYQGLPDSIPIHYGFTGQVTNYGNKANIFLVPLVHTFLFVGLTVLNKYPHIFNYPVEITEKNAPQQYKNATRLFRYCKFIITLMFLWIKYQTIQVSMGKSESLEIRSIYVMIGVIFILIIYYLVKSIQTKG